MSTKLNKNKYVTALSIPLLLALSVSSAFAGTDTSFASLHTQFTNWITGTAGKTIALASIGVGGIMSIGRGPVPILLGIGVAALLMYLPSATDSVFTATI